jgi:hypothetical protein
MRQIVALSIWTKQFVRDLDAGLQIRMAIARKKSMPVDIVAKKKRDFDSRLNDITLERFVNRDGIRIYG